MRRTPPDRWRRRRSADAEGPARTGVRPSVVTFVTRAGCHLCSEAQPVVQRLAGAAGVGFEVRDVDADPADRARWSDHVPVVLLDGHEHSYWFVDEAELRNALS